MTMISLKRKKQELLASKVSSLVSDTNENLLRVNLTKFFTDLEAEIQKALLEYYNDTFMLQGQINLILAPIHEKHQEYYELIMRHKLQEFKRAKQSANRVVKREQKRVAMKSAKPVNFIHNRNNLFGTLQYSEDRLANNTFTASQNTLNRVDSNINEILTDGYRSGKGINEVGRQITERFDQLRTWEANRIARTEIHTAQNMGIMSSYESLGVEYTQWIAANDDRTRDSHIEVDGEIIAFGETYSNGLSFPGDTSGPIEEWINCRCSNAPFVMPAGMMAPPFSPFKESDLVPIEVEPVQPTEPIVSEPINPRIAELEKQLEDVKAIEQKWRKRGNDSLADTFATQISQIERELSKLKKPNIKVVKEPKKPEIDIDKIMQDALRDAGVETKPKKKPKQKSKPKPKPKPNKEVIEVSLEEHLRNNLPKELGDDAISYIADRVRKRGTVKREYGQIFDYRTGKTHSPEFKGGKGSVHIKTEDWIKPKKQMTMEEMIDAISNPQKYKKSYINKSNTLASQHNHPPDGCRAPSGADFYVNLISEWEDYGFQISNEEVWCIEYKGKMNMIDAKEIEKGCGRAFKKAKRQAEKTVMRDYDHLEPKEKSQMKAELTKDYYADNLVEFIDKNKHGIKLHRVVL